ncbi:MAG: helix-turn-helix domain-containing protein [Candidatus Woesearchaeota archaeon]|jgi:sugar-specific transcriptional regulator TrmB
MLKETLKSIGMTFNEVELYLALLKSGECSVNEISTKAGLHRQVCYDALDRLLEKGFVSYILKENKKYFKALEPKKIIDYLNEKREEVSSILPELDVYFKTEKDETTVELIKGKNVMRTIYNDIIKTLKEENQELYAMGVDESKFLEYDKIAIQQYLEKMKKHKLKEHLLSKESATTFFEGPQSEYRLLPDHLFNPNPTHIYGNKIALIVWGNPMYGIMINSKQVADANKKYFKLLWSIAKKR